MGLNIKQIETLQNAIDIAAVRNANRELMTHDQTELTYADQLDWFYNVYKPGNKREELFAFAGYLALRPAAYGLISEREGSMWLTGAIKPEYQGQGYGRQLFTFLTRYTLDYLKMPEARLDVLEDNDKARKLYESLGYVAVGYSDGIIEMVREADYGIAA